MIESKAENGVYAPDYYSNFKCIADRCRNSCCINWEICIDKDTYSKYMKLDNISHTVETGEDGPCFKLCEDGKCPHLNNAGLCNIIISYGEGYLSEICRSHPRFYNSINGGRIEVGLGIVCEEACRLILENENPFSLSKIDSLDDIDINGSEICFDAISKRESIFSIIKTDGKFDEKIAEVKKLFKLPELYTQQGWIDRFMSLEMLDDDWGKDLNAAKSRAFLRNNEISDKYSKYYERLLTYFVYRHVGVAENEEDFRARLAFCVLSVEMIRLLFELNNSEKSCEDSEKISEKLIDWARRYSVEIEYSEDNTDELIFAFKSNILA